MNCYAYALQVDYKDSVNSNAAYKLLPGEFSISAQNRFQQYSDLVDEYNYYQGLNYYDAQAQSKLNLFFDFVEQQMYGDAVALNFDINRFGTTNIFSMPMNYDENSERIIAAIVYYKYNEYSANTLDFHYYVRHGNGSCKQVGHSIDCSTWSHKRETGPIENANNTLCDETISTKALSLIPVGDYGTMCDQVRYYTITKDAFLYNSWHGNGHASTSTGTPYRPQ